MQEEEEEQGQQGKHVPHALPHATQMSHQSSPLDSHRTWHWFSLLYLALCISLSLRQPLCALSLASSFCIIVQFCAWPSTSAGSQTHTHTLPHSNNNLTLFLLLLPRAPLHDRTTFARAPPPSSPPHPLRAQLQTETANETKHQHNFPALKTKWNYDYEKRNPKKVWWINPWRGCTTRQSTNRSRGREGSATNACRNENVMFSNEIFELWCFLWLGRDVTERVATIAIVTIICAHRWALN